MFHKKKERSKEQKTVQSKSGETKTADAKSQSGSVETKEAVSLDTKMAKVDTDIKDIGKNLEDLWSGTIVQPYNNGLLYKKSALSLTKKELIDEVIHQILECKE
mgnify:CR=1 FL=1